MKEIEIWQNTDGAWLVSLDDVCIGRFENEDKAREWVVSVVDYNDGIKFAVIG